MIKTLLGGDTVLYYDEENNEIIIGNRDKSFTQSFVGGLKSRVQTLESGPAGPPAAWGSVTGTLSDQTDLNTALSGKAASSHTHSASDVTGTAVVTNDSRLSDARQLAAGADKTKLDGIAAGATVGADWNTNVSNKPTLGGAAALNVGSTIGTVAAGDDSRMTNSRTPTAHASSHVTGGSDVIASVVAGGNSGLMTGADKTKLDGIATGAVADHVNIANKGTNTHAQIDTFISSKAAASGLASLDANSKLVQLRARADDGLGYAVLANDTLAQAYATNSVTKLTVTASRTLTTTVPPAGCYATTIILTSGTTSFTITFGSGFKPTGTLATGTTTARVFVVNWISDGTNLYEAGRTAAMAA